MRAAVAIIQRLKITRRGAGVAVGLRRIRPVLSRASEKKRLAGFHEGQY
jgi:hypothetical protein